MRILGIDPGKSGAFVLHKGDALDWAVMPLDGESIDFKKIVDLIAGFSPDHIFLERAIPFAMGSKGAFNYGRGFAALEIAAQLASRPMTYVEPAKWTKEMFAGIDTRMKPKERGRIALKRLFPSLVDTLPTDKKGNVHDGVQDALLIAEWGRRRLPMSLGDF